MQRNRWSFSNMKPIRKTNKDELDFRIDYNDSQHKQPSLLVFWDFFIVGQQRSQRILEAELPIKLCFHWNKTSTVRINEVSKSSENLRSAKRYTAESLLNISLSMWIIITPLLWHIRCGGGPLVIPFYFFCSCEVTTAGSVSFSNNNEGVPFCHPTSTPRIRYINKK